jgi:ribonucleotide reductase class II
MLEDRFISQLPEVINNIDLKVVGNYGDVAKDSRTEETLRIGSLHDEDLITIVVGDSREGWVKAYQTILELSSDENLGSSIDVTVDVSHVRPEGEELKGFGGIANPALIGGMFPKITRILNGAIGRKLTAKECCLLIDEAAKVVVAGSIRRSAGMRMFDKTDPVYKLNLWQEGEDGQWRIDPERDAMRMANHTRVYHTKPTEEECIDAVRLQFQSGEGAIQYAPEAIARANADILDTPEKKQEFLKKYTVSQNLAGGYLEGLALDKIPQEEIEYRLTIYGLNPLTLAA